MANIFKCDRCNKIIDTPGYVGGLLTLFDINPFKGSNGFGHGPTTASQILVAAKPPHFGSADTSRELCSVCVAELEIWLKTPVEVVIEE